MGYDKVEPGEELFDDSAEKEARSAIGPDIEPLGMVGVAVDVAVDAGPSAGAEALLGKDAVTPALSPELAGLRTPEGNDDLSALRGSVRIGLPPGERQGQPKDSVAEVHCYCIVHHCCG